MAQPPRAQLRTLLKDLFDLDGLRIFAQDYYGSLVDLVTWNKSELVAAETFVAALQREHLADERLFDRIREARPAPTLRQRIEAVRAACRPLMPSLIEPEPTPGAGPASEVEPPAAPSYATTAWLPRSQVNDIFRRAKEEGLHHDREALIAGLPTGLKARLPRTRRAVAQVLADLHALNAQPALPDDLQPLQVWLENADLISEEGVSGRVSGRRRAMLGDETLRSAQTRGGRLEGQPVAAEAFGVEPSADEPPADGSLRGTLQAAMRQLAAASRAAEEEAAQAEADLQAIEGIVLSEERPVLLVRDDTFEAPSSATWRQELAAHRDRVERAIRATGRLEIHGDPRLPYLGAAAVVGPDLIALPRSLAGQVVDGVGTGDLRFKEASGRPVRVGFSPRRERGHDGVELPVAELLLVHPVLELAIARVPGLAATGLPHLPLAAAEPEPGALVAEVGYPDRDPRVDTALQDRVMGGVYGIKRLAVGKVVGREPLGSFATAMLVHDCSTLAGGGGAVVAALDSGSLLGLQVARVYLKANYAVPAWEIARDRRVRDLGVAVAAGAPPPDDPWAEAWAALER